MSQTRKQYTREFKLEALQLAKTSGKPHAGLEGVVVLGQVSMFGRPLSRRATRRWVAAVRWSSSRLRVWLDLLSIDSGEVQPASLPSAGQAGDAGRLGCRILIDQLT